MKKILGVFGWVATFIAGVLIADHLFQIEQNVWAMGWGAFVFILADGVEKLIATWESA